MTNVRRAEVAARIHDAKEHGDLSENAEYEDAKNEQAFVEGRIQTLEALIKNATIIDENHSTEHVQIGSTVNVESADGAETFTIVGSAEASPRDGRISNESPGRSRPARQARRARRSSSASPPATSPTRSSRSVDPRAARLGPPTSESDCGSARGCNSTRGTGFDGLGRRARHIGQRPAGRQRLEDAVRDRPCRQPPRPGRPRRDRRALRARGIETTFLYGVDDLDPMDAQALLTPDAVERYMGRPLAHVPDQAGDGHASYARHHAQVVHRHVRRPRHPARPLLLDERASTRRARWTRTSGWRSTGRPSSATSTAGSPTSSSPTRGTRSGSSARAAARSARRSSPTGTASPSRTTAGPDLVTWARGCGIDRAGSRRSAGAPSCPGTWNGRRSGALFGVTIERCGKDLATAGGSRDRSRRDRARGVRARAAAQRRLRVPQRRRPEDVDLEGHAARPPTRSPRSCRPSSSGSSSCARGPTTRSNSIPTAPTRSLASSTSSTGSRRRPPAARSRASCRRLRIDVPLLARCDPDADVAAEAAAYRPRVPPPRAARSRSRHRARRLLRGPRRGAPLTDREREIARRADRGGAALARRRTPRNRSRIVVRRRGAARGGRGPRPTTSAPISRRWRAPPSGPRPRPGDAWQALIFATRAERPRCRRAARSARSTVAFLGRRTARAPAGCSPSLDPAFVLERLREAAERATATGGARA